MISPKKAWKVFIGVIGVMVFFVTSISPFYASNTLLDPTNVQAKVHAYFLKYCVSTNPWSRGTLDSEGNFVSSSSGNFYVSPFIPVPDYCQTFALRFQNNSSSYFYNIYSLCEYDSNKDYLILHEGNYLSYYRYPSASYVRYVIQFDYNISNMNNYGYAVFIPERVSVTSAYSQPYYWSDFEDVTISDPFIILPYQAYGYNMIRLRFDFFEDARLTNHISLNLDVEVSDYGVQSGWHPGLDGNSFAVLQPYYYDSFGQLHYVVPNVDLNGGIPLIVDDVLGTLSCDEAFFSPGSFSGFDVLFNFTNSFSSYYRFQITWLEFDDTVYSVSVEASDVLDDLSNLGDQIAMPTPNADVILDQVNNVAGQMNDDAFTSMNWFGANDGMVSTMLITVLLFSALGYIFFGKIAS